MGYIGMCGPKGRVFSRFGHKLGMRFKKVINRVGKIADFGHKYGKGFAKRVGYLHPIFLGVPPWTAAPPKRKHRREHLCVAVDNHDLYRNYP